MCSACACSPKPTNSSSSPAPGAIGEIFRADPRLLHAAEGNQILGAVMGEHSVLLVDQEAHRRVRGLLITRLQAIINISPTIFVEFKFPLLQRIPPWKGFAENHARIDAILDREIESRRTSADLAERNDVLSRLVHADGDSRANPLTDAELRDQLVSLLLAGHETTAAALTWTL